MSKTATVTSEFKATAHRVIDDAAEKVETLEKRARERATDAADSVSRSAETAKEGAQQAWDQLETKWRERPLATAGVAFAAGILASMFLRRSR